MTVPLSDGDVTASKLRDRRRLAAAEFAILILLLENAVAGFLLGVVYLLFGRNLTVPVIAHGVQDTVDLALIFLGKYPGM